MKLLDVKKLKISIPAENATLVHGSSFEVDAGKSLIILGQSGSGKTMTCHALMGLLDTKKYVISGEVVLGESSILNMSGKEKRKIYGQRVSLIPQNPMTAFDPSIRVGNQMVETLRFHRKCNKLEAKSCAVDALNKAGLSNAEHVFRCFPYELSGGMLQRVVIAMALMMQVQLVIADEPTTALDVQHRNEIIEQFINLRNLGVSIILITHDFSVARQFGGEMIVMKDGLIIENGDMAEIMNNPKHEYVKELLKASVLTGNNAHGNVPQKVREAC